MEGVDVERPEGECLATFWRQKSPGSAYVRCALPARALPAQTIPLTEQDGYWDEENERAVFPRQRGAAVWQFAGVAARALIMDEMAAQGVRVLMEVDDNYLIAPPHANSPDWFQTLAEHGANVASREQHRLTTKRVADGVIVSTERLADIYFKVNPNVYVCRNCVDKDDWPGPFKPEDGIFRIGYAGGAAHTRDFPIVQRALEWASTQPDVEIVAIGDAVPPDLPWVTYTEWTDNLASFRLNLHVLDVGVCPLQKDLWSACKSDLKVLEYAMAGALPIVSPEEPYRDWLDSPVLVAQKYKEWEEAIRWCVANRDEVRQLADETKEIVLRDREISVGVNAWREAIEG